jgi:hypothetical protein
VGRDLPTPPPGGTIEATLNWLEQVNKSETKQQRNELRTKIQNGIIELLQDELFSKSDHQTVFWRKIVQSVVVQKHVNGLALIAGSAYNLIRTNRNDQDLLTRPKVLEQRLEALLEELASLQGLERIDLESTRLAEKIDTTFVLERKLRNTILQKSHSVTKVNTFLLGSSRHLKLADKMPTYYKSIGEFIFDCSEAYQNAADDNSSAKARHKRHANEWSAFAQKFLIDSKKLRSKKSEKDWLEKTGAVSRYQPLISQSLGSKSSNRTQITVSAVQRLTKVESTKSSDFYLRNGVEIDFKAQGAQGFLAIANFPPSLKSTPFRIMAEIQHLAQKEQKLPEMTIGFVGDPPSGLEIRIGSHASLEIYELFAEFIVRALATIR